MRSEDAFHSPSATGALSGHVHSYRRVHGTAGSERLDYDRTHHARRSRRPVWPAGCCHSYLRRGNCYLSSKGFRCISSPCANPNDPGRPFGNGDDQNRNDEFRHQHQADEREAPRSTGSRAPHSIRCARHSAGTQPVGYLPPITRTRVSPEPATTTHRRILHRKRTVFTWSQLGIYLYVT
jgi:hypothetical protein